MNLTTFKNLEWYILNETDKGKLLFLKDVFNVEQIKMFFKDKSMLDDSFDVKFNKNLSNPWFRDTYIREVLNRTFAPYLGIRNLNLMDTIVELNGKKVSTRDYVRLITLKEIKKLSKEILKTNNPYGYWTMNPSINKCVYSNVHIISSSGDLFDRDVKSTAGIRPVILLKTLNN